MSNLSTRHKDRFIINDPLLLGRINSISLSKEDNDQITMALRYFTGKRSNYYPKGDELITFVKNLYTMYYKLDMSCNDIGIIFKKNANAVARLLSNIGLCLRNRNEYQIIASTKRDYEGIILKSRMTQLKSLSKSNSEDYIRNALYLGLKNRFPNIELIVGINSPCFNKRYEADIPVIVIRNKSVLKWIIEINGTAYHKENRAESDLRKIEIYEEMGYVVLSYAIKNSNSATLDSVVTQAVNAISSETEAIYS